MYIKSPKWDTCSRLAKAVQSSSFSFENLTPDPLPKDLRNCIYNRITFHILLRNGLFSKAVLKENDHGFPYWQYPSGQLYSGDSFHLEDVIAYIQYDFSVPVIQNVFSGFFFPIPL